MHADALGTDSPDAPGHRTAEHSSDRAAGIIGFADTPFIYQALRAPRVAQLQRERQRGDRLIVDQDTEEIVFRRDA